MLQLTKHCHVKQFLAQKLIPEMEHQPYSLNLAPNDFWLFTETKSALKDDEFTM